MKGPTTGTCNRDFPKTKANPLKSYCLHLFSAQEAEPVPARPLRHTGPLPHLALPSPSPTATPICRPHFRRGVCEASLRCGRQALRAHSFSLAGAGPPH